MGDTIDGTRTTELNESSTNLTLEQLEATINEYIEVTDRAMGPWRGVQAFVFRLGEWAKIRRALEGPDRLGVQDGSHLFGMPVYVAYTEQEYGELLYRLTQERGLRVGVLGEPALGDAEGASRFSGRPEGPRVSG